MSGFDVEAARRSYENTGNPAILAACDEIERLRAVLGEIAKQDVPINELVQLWQREKARSGLDEQAEVTRLRSLLAEATARLENIREAAQGRIDTHDESGFRGWISAHWVEDCARATLTRLQREAP